MRIKHGICLEKKILVVFCIALTQNVSDQNGFMHYLCFKTFHGGQFQTSWWISGKQNSSFELSLAQLLL